MIYGYGLFQRTTSMATQSPEKARGRKGEGAPYPLTRSRGGGDALRSRRRLIYRDQWE